MHGGVHHRHGGLIYVHNEKKKKTGPAAIFRARRLGYLHFLVWPYRVKTNRLQLWPKAAQTIHAAVEDRFFLALRSQLVAGITSQDGVLDLAIHVWPVNRVVRVVNSS